MSAVAFTLTWDTGMVQAAPLYAPGYEDSFWLYVPWDALAADARLSAGDTWGQFSRVILSSGQDLSGEGLPLSQLGYIDAGAEPGMNYLDVFAVDTMGQTAGACRLFISTVTDMPLISPVVNPITVSVACMDENGNVISSYTRDCPAGSTVITAEPIEGYDMDPGWPAQAEVI